MLNLRDYMADWFERVWNRGDADAIDELMSSEVVCYGLEPGRIMRGPAAFRESLWRPIRDRLPELRLTLDDSIQKGDQIAVWLTGRFPRTDLSIRGATIATIRDGRMAEAWNCWDNASLPGELAIPMSQTARDCLTRIDAIYAAFNANDFAALEPMYHPNMVGHDTLGTMRGTTALRGLLEGYHRGFPGHAYRVVAKWAGDNIAAVHWVVDGSHTRSFYALEPTGNSFTVHGRSVVRFDQSGRVVEVWQNWDKAGWERQLGLETSLEEAAGLASPG